MFNFQYYYNTNIPLNIIIIVYYKLYYTSVYVIFFHDNVLLTYFIMKFLSWIFIIAVKKNRNRFQQDIVKNIFEKYTHTYHIIFVFQIFHLFYNFLAYSYSFSSSLSTLFIFNKIQPFKYLWCIFSGLNISMSLVHTDSNSIYFLQSSLFIFSAGWIGR